MNSYDLLLHPPWKYLDFMLFLKSLKRVLQDNCFAIKHSDDTADVIQFIKTELQESGALHEYIPCRLL